MSNSPDEILVYSEYSMSFSFRDRAMCERFKIAADSTGIAEISWTEDWESNTENTKGTVRMPRARGLWKFEPLDNHSSKSTHVVLADPAGSIPSWPVDSTVEKGMSKELKSIETIAQKLNNKRP